MCTQFYGCMLLFLLECNCWGRTIVLFSRSVVFDSLRPQGLQHTRLLCPSPTPGAHSNSHVHRVGDAIQPSCPLLSPYPTAFNLSQNQGLFQCLPKKSMKHSLKFLVKCLWGMRSPVTSSQFSLVAQSCPTLCDPMNHSTPGLPVHHSLPESTQTLVHWVSDAIQPSHPLSSPSPPALNLSQHLGLFKWVTLHIRLPKSWSFGFNISPSSEHPGLISFRIDWLDLLAV